MAALAAVLVACSGDDTATPTLVTESTVATTSAPSTTAARPTTSTSTTSSSPSTTSVASLEDQIRADFESTWLAFYECGYEPAACDYAAVVVPGTELEAQMRAEMQTMVEAGLRGIPGSGIQRYSIESIEVDADGTEATVVSCLVDGTVVVDIRDPNDPSDDIIFNDALNAYRTKWTFRLTDAGWRRLAGERIGVFQGAESCEA